MNRLLNLIIALLFGGASLYAANTVTISYLNTDGSKTEVRPTEHEYTINEDGTVTLYNFQNSGVHVCFGLGKSVKPIKFTPVDGWAVQSSYVIKKDSINARFNLVKEGEMEFKYNGDTIVVTDPVFNGPIYVMPYNSTVTLASEDDDNYYYKVSFYTTLAYGNFTYQPVENISGATIPLSNYARYCYAVCEIPVEKPAKYLSFLNESGDTIYNDVKRSYAQKGDHSFTINNFANSGKPLSLTVSGSRDENGNFTLLGLDDIDNEKASEYQSVQDMNASLTSGDGASFSGDVRIKLAGSYAEVTSTNYQRDIYLVHLLTKYGDTECVTVFECEGTRYATEENTDVRIYNPTDGKVDSEFKACIEKCADGTYVYYDFLGSGTNLAFTLDEEKMASNDSGSWLYRGLIMNENSAIVYSASWYHLAPDYGFVTDFIGRDGAQVKANCVWIANSASTRLRVYEKDENSDGKDRINYHIYAFVDSKYYMIEWNEFEDETQGDVNGIGEIAAGDDNAPVEWYNLQGIRVSENALVPGIYIRRQGSKSVKVLVK